MTRTELIHKLVTTYHLNMPERAMLGGPVTHSELRDAVYETVARQNAIQCPIGELKLLNGQLYELRREYEIGISQTEEVRWQFDSLAQASAALVSHILNDHPRGTIDGIMIVE